MGITRREFFQRLTVAAVGSVAAGSAARAAEPTSAPGDTMLSMSGMHMGVDLTTDRFPRVDPNFRYSSPPALMGHQMGRVHTLSHPPLGYELDGNVKVFRLIAQPVRVTITQGTPEAEHQKMVQRTAGRYAQFRPMPTVAKQILAWGYNGVCPGPTLEATEGDRVRIIFKNELPEPTSIHWHGMELPFAQDGAAGYQPHDPQRPVLPGEAWTYEFTLHQSGTLLYHTGFNMMKQDGLGLGGLFVIHPKNLPARVDKDFAILSQTWNFAPGNQNPNVTAMEPSFATFNGRTSPDIEMMTVRQGERVRIRIGNLSLMAHPIHFHGYTFKVVSTNGGPIPESAQWPEVTVNVPPGTTRDIEFVAWNPGVWRFHCHILHHIMNAMTDMPMGIMAAEGMFTYLNVIPADPTYDIRSPKAPWRHPSQEGR